MSSAPIWLREHLECKAFLTGPISSTLAHGVCRQLATGAGNAPGQHQDYARGPIHAIGFLHTVHMIFLDRSRALPGRAALVRAGAE